MSCVGDITDYYDSLYPEVERQRAQAKAEFEYLSWRSREQRDPGGVEYESWEARHGA